MLFYAFWNSRTGSHQEAQFTTGGTNCPKATCVCLQGVCMLLMGLSSRQTPEARVYFESFQTGMRNLRLSSRCDGYFQTCSFV